MRAEALVFPPAATACPIRHCHAPRWFCNSSTLVSDSEVRIIARHTRLRTSESKGHQQSMILVRFLDLKFLQTRGYNDRNFKSTALALRLPSKEGAAAFRSGL